MTPFPGLLLLAVSVGAQSFFSGAEAALVSADQDKLETAAGNGNQGAHIALRFRENQQRMVGTCLIGTNLSLVSSATLVAVMLAEAGHPSMLVATALLVPIALTFGEALPRAIYRHHADALAPLAARFLALFERVVFRAPLWVVDRWAGALHRLPGEPAEVSREGIVELLEDDDAGGDIDPEDKAMIRRLFGMSDTSVASCMTPLVDLVAVSKTASVSDAAALVLQHGKSRLPVYQDRIDNIVGLVEHRDLLFGATSDEARVADLVKPVCYVPEAKSTAHLLRELRNNGEHVAAVVDEYGGAVGLVTLEDLLEEVLGEIRDERDKAGPGVRRLGERDWRVPARTEVEDLSEIIGHELPEGPYETIAGLVLQHTGRIPQTGEVLRVGPFTIHVEDASERAIQTVRLTVPRPTEEPAST